jgi:3-dehydroquinate synthase
MQRLRVAPPSRAYDVLVGRGALDELGAAVAALGTSGQVVVCSDGHVAPLYLERVGAGLRAAGFEISHIVIPPGEGQKTLARVEEAYGVLYERGIGRGDTVVALGGGVVGDLFGYVAATYQRGLRLVQAPTTLLAQVDAGVGGKTGVDFRAGKNHVGAFYQPWLVVVDPDVLRTLPVRELRSGAAEVVKYGLMAGGRLLDEVEAAAQNGALDAERFDEALIAGCLEEKIAVVEDDEREETGNRAVLNLGHTVGHAVEAAGGFSRFTHGEAVALGLRAALRLSVELCGLPQSEADRGAALLDALGLPAHAAGLDPEEVAGLIRRDKKAGPEGVAYVLLEGLGRPRTGLRVPSDLEREVVAWLTSE